MSHDEWGPRYGTPSHPTTGELPRVGNGQSTDELRTVQVDTVAEPPRQESRSRYRYSWETSAPRQPSEPPSGGWSVPRIGPEGSAPRIAQEGPPLPREGSAPRIGPESPPRPAPEGPPPRAGRDDTAQFARVGDGRRGSVGPISVQIDHVRVEGAATGDTQLLPTAAFMRPRPEEATEAVEAPQPEAGTGPMPAMRRQMGPDWTQMPLRLLAAAVVATAVLAASAAGLVSIGDWINP